MRPVGTVLWDADGVLQRVPGGAEESMRPAVEGLVDDVDAFLAEAVAAERPALRGEVRWLDVLPGLLARWGIADAEDDVVRVWLSFEEVPAARALVAELRGRGVRCALATNQDESRAERMRRELGYETLLDTTFWSYELGAAKPEAAYFERVLERLDAEPRDVLLVDDNAANVAVARELGLRAEQWSHRDPVDRLRSYLARHGALPPTPRPA